MDGEKAPTSGIVTPGNEDRSDTQDFKIVTEESERQDSYPPEKEITINGRGLIKDRDTGEIKSEDGEVLSPLPNPDFSQYNEKENEVETASVVTPAGKRIYENPVDSKNSGAAQDLDSGDWMETRNSKEAPKTDTFYSLEEKENEAEESTDTPPPPIEPPTVETDETTEESTTPTPIVAPTVETDESPEESKATEDSNLPEGWQREFSDAEVSETEGSDIEPVVDTTPEEELPTDLDVRLDNIDTSLEEINSKIDNLTVSLEDAELRASLDKEQLIDLIVEQNALYGEQSRLRGERLEVLFQRQSEQNRIIINNLLDRVTNVVPSVEPEETPEETTTAPIDPENVQPDEETPDETAPPIAPDDAQPEETAPTVEPTTVTPEGNTQQDSNLQDFQSRLRNLEDQNRDLRGENTWEQRVADYDRQLAELREIESTRPLTNEEKIRYYNLDRERRYLDKNIITPEQEESKRRRERKEKIIKIVAGGAGFAVALATPAVGVAALVAVSVGGRFAGRGLKSWSEKIRAKSNAMKYENRQGKSRAELEQMDKKQRRKAWWADRLGEAAAVVTGGSIGFSIGSAVQSLTGWRIGGGGNAAAAEAAGAGGGVEEAGAGAGSGAEGGAGAGAGSGAEGGAGAGPGTPVSDIGGMPEAVGEGLGGAESFNASEYGWDFERLGWLGDRVSVSSQGGAPGLLQKDFFGELTKLVPKEQLMGQAPGDITNQFLRQAYNGADPVQAAQNAAQAILGQ